MTDPTESQTRKALIAPTLCKAGWDVDNPDQVRIEIPVDGFDPAARCTRDAKYEIHVHDGGQVGTIGDAAEIRGSIPFESDQD
jgi:hypothetical protein